MKMAVILGDDLTRRNAICVHQDVQVTGAVVYVTGGFNLLAAHSTRRAVWQSAPLI